jgi:hypothetical protein
VRGDTALCQLHDQFFRPGPACSGFEAREAEGSVQQFLR